MDIQNCGAAPSRRMSADYFTGAVWQDPIVEAPAPARVRSAYVRFEPVEDLKPFGLEMLSYFESPPLQEALGNRDVITVLRQALATWKGEAL